MSSRLILLLGKLTTVIGDRDSVAEIVPKVQHRAIAAAQPALLGRREQSPGGRLVRL